VTIVMSDVLIAVLPQALEMSLVKALHRSSNRSIVCDALNRLGRCHARAVGI
jgi:hypothetical protein